MALHWLLVVFLATSATSKEDADCSRKNQDFLYNALTNIWSEKYFFKKLEDIYVINFEKYCLNSLRPKMFQRTVHLRHLDLSHNSLTTLPYQVFSSSTELSRLDLSYNSLVTLDHRTFNGLKSLSYLDLSNNLLKELARRLFNGNNALSHLNISNNKLERFEYGLLNSTTQLAHLNMDNNFVTFLDYRTFNLANKLTHFSIKNNSLETVDYRTFATTTVLSRMDLSFNSLDVLDRRLFSNLTDLVYLNLENNKLNVLNESRLFMSQQNLTTLLLGHNNITTIDVNVLKPLESVEELDLAGNKLECNCGLRLAMLWCADRDLATNTACSNPPEVRGMAWNVNYKGDCRGAPSGNSSAIIVAGASAACVILFVVVVGSAVFRWKRKVKRTFCRTSQAPLDGFIYDDVVHPDHYVDVGQVNVFKSCSVGNARTVEPNIYDYTYI